MIMNRHFQYINTIRRPNGTLRDWREYDTLEKYEQWASDARETANHLDALKIKDTERVQCVTRRTSKLPSKNR